MTAKKLKEYLDDIPDDSEVSIVNTFTNDYDGEILYQIDAVIFDTVDTLFIEVTANEI